MATTTPFPASPASHAQREAKPVNLAIVGVNFGAGIARNLARDNRFINVTAVCDSDTEKANRLGTELCVQAHNSLDQVLTNTSVEAVGLFTPPIGRAKLIQRVLESGRHVMTTKPFELDCAAAEAVLLEAEKRGLAVHMNSPAPVPAEDIAQIKKWEMEHGLGAPIAMRAATWANYREVRNGTWYDDPALCPAAPIFRLGVYFLNDFAVLLGEPKRVHVTQSRIFTGRPTADNAQLCIEFANGALANIFASFCIGDGKPWSDEVTLNYERGTIRRWVERTDGGDMSGDHAVMELQRPGGEDGLRFKTRPGGFAGWYEWEAFHDAIRGEINVPLQNAEHVLFGMRLLNAMSRSAASGQPEFLL
jgi:predicted dehydrogenase